MARVGIYRKLMNCFETYTALGASFLLEPGSPGLQVATMVRRILLAGFAVLLPSIAQAQNRGMMPAVSHAMPAAPRPLVRATQPVVAHAATGQRLVMRTGVTHSRATTPTARSIQRPAGTQRRRLDSEDRVMTPGCSSVPGLGFDVPHLAATCGPDAVGAGGHQRQSPLFFPFFDGGFFLPGAPAVVEEPAAGEAQQSEDAEAEVPERGRRVRVSRETPAPAAVVEPEKTPIRETEQYVFVRRDGTVFFAVAYAWENGALRYVTSEGLRRSVARDALDLDATQQFNEQRGLNFRLPA